jgi:hypothetical protein
VNRFDCANVTVHGYGKPTDKLPVKPASPEVPTRILLPANDELDRGRKPVLRDELAVVASINVNPRGALTPEGHRGAPRGRFGAGSSLMRKPHGKYEAFRKDTTDLVSPNAIGT